MMNEQMQVWVRLFGSEYFEGELDYLLASYPQQASQDSAQQVPLMLWDKATLGADASLIQGNTVLRWGRSQRQFRAQAPQALPDLNRPFVVLDPTLGSVPQSVRCDPRSRDALMAMWEAFDAELEPVRLKFCLGQRSFDLLSRMHNRFTSLAQYHLDHAKRTVVTLQPAEGQLYVSPQATAAASTHGMWRRRSASAKPAERFERLALPHALGVYCQRTTKRLFSSRLRAARISLRAQAVIRLADHNDQVLAILVRLHAGQCHFADLAPQLDVDEQTLGNALLGLYLSGMVELELGSSVSTLFAPELRKSRASSE